MNSYANGATVRLSCTFLVDEVATDPTEVTLRVKDPDGTLVTYTLAGGTVTRDAEGVYHKDVALSGPGRWRYRWEGTGTAPGAEESACNVERGAFS